MTLHEMVLRRQIILLERRLRAAEEVVVAARGYCDSATLAACAQLEQAVLDYDDPWAAWRVRSTRFDFAVS